MNLNFLDNKKSYITGYLGIALFIVENILGIDIPGGNFDINTLLGSLAVLGIRHGIAKK